MALALVCLAVPATASERVLAIGDIHGSLDGLQTILREAALTDEAGRWIGGTTRVVQTGDFTDRGDRVRDVMDLLIGLQSEALAAGGELDVLLGNHELLNLMRHDLDVRVNPAIYASFADEGSAERRRQALGAWRKWLRERKRITGLEPPATTDEEWLAEHPLGFVEYHEALGPDGEYGRWLRDLPAVRRVDRTIFLHGGLSDAFLTVSLERINELHREEIASFDDTVALLERKAVIGPSFTWKEIESEIALRLDNPKLKRQRDLVEKARQRLGRFLGVTSSPDSPLWYRGFAAPPHGLDDTELAALRDRLVEAFDASHFVVAHSPFNGDEIKLRLDAFFLIDTGMLAAVYGGKPSALEITAGGFAAIYPGRREVLLAAGAEASEAVPAIARSSSFATTDRGVERRSQFVFATARSQDPPPPPLPGDDFEKPRRRWLDRDGEPLPFVGLDDVERFLSGAHVLSREPVGEGKSGAERLELELDGVRARAIFHDIDDRRDPTSGGGPIRLSRGSTMLRFRDSYTGQTAGYRLARLMGLDNVPPAVVRTIDGVEGSLALWIEGGTNLTAWRQTHPRGPQHAYYQQQLYDMRIFDALVNNKDRNTGNIFWTSDWNLWLIDHTRAFAQDPDLYRPDFVQRCSRELLERIRSLDEKEVQQSLKPFLSIFEIKSIFKRRKRLLRHLDQRIEKLGEERVLFDYGDPVGSAVVTQADGAAA